MHWVDVRQFSYTYPGEERPALKEINLSLEMGEFVVVTGKSGSGKSTFGKALAGFLFQDEVPQFSGEIVVNDTDMTQLALYDVSDRVGYVQQNPEDQFCTLTVLDEIAFGLENQCMPPEEIEQRLDEALRIVNGLELKSRELSTLSGGEKQKIAIASMLALSPDVLILDEPTSNLDPVATKHILDTLYQIRLDQRLTVIIIEHKLAQLMPLKPRLFEIEAGELHPMNNANSSHRSKNSAPLINSPSQQSQKQTRQPIIQLSKVNVNRGGKHILHDINLCLKPGEFVALMGANGSGKTTLLETIMGFHKSASGSAKAFEEKISDTPITALVNQIGYIFQNPDHQLFTQSVWEEAVLTLKNLKRYTEEKATLAKDLLTQMGLLEKINAHPQRLSYGEKRRLNLIAALLHDPQLLLIDELLIGQDMKNAHTWMMLLKEYTQIGNTVLLINHHAALTQTYCDRVIFLEGGKVIVDQPTSQAFATLSLQGYAPFLPTFQWEPVHA